MEKEEEGFQEEDKERRRFKRRRLTKRQTTVADTSGIFRKTCRVEAGKNRRAITLLLPLLWRFQNKNPKVYS